MTILEYDEVPSNDVLESATAELRSFGASYGTKNFVTTPTVIPWTRAARIERVCQTVMRGLDALRDIVCGGNIHELARLCRVPPPAVPALDLMVQDWAMIARPDILLTDDEAWVIEMNCDSPAGQFALHDVMVRAQCAIPAVQAGLAKLDARPVAVVPPLVSALEAASALPGTAIAITYWEREEKADPLWWWYYRCLAIELERHGARTITCPVEALELGNSRVGFKDTEIGVLYRFFEFPALDAADEIKMLSRVADAVKRGAVGIFTGYRGELLADKTSLALLSDERTADLLDSRLAGELAGCVPWTRIVENRSTRWRESRVDLLPFVSSHRSEMILKRIHGAGGSGVLIGNELTPPDWEAALGRAVRETAHGNAWVVQEIVKTVPEEVTMIESPGRARRIQASSVYGAFMVHRRLVGMMKRYGMAPDRSLNINMITGFAPTPIYWTGDASKALTSCSEPAPG